METNTKQAARKILTDQLVEKKSYAHDTNTCYGKMDKQIEDMHILYLFCIERQTGREAYTHDTSSEKQVKI